MQKVTTLKLNTAFEFMKNNSYSKSTRPWILAQWQLYFMAVV